MNLNKRNVESLTLAPQDKIYYQIFRDDKLAGFCVRVASTGTKTFIIDKKVSGKLIRFNIGRFGELTADEARKEAQKLLGQLATGNDPIKDRKEKKQGQITLRQAFDDYLSARKTLKARTRSDYEKMLEFDFSDWLDKPLIAITKDMVVNRHADIGTRTQAGANNALKLISAIFNFSIAQYEGKDGESVLSDNPVQKLSRIRAWYPKRRRRTKIDNYQLTKWFRAVNELRDLNKASIANSVKHYLLLLLFTGLRREEALPLIWADQKSMGKEAAKKEHLLDLQSETLFIPDPKNRQEHWLPLTPYLCELFKKHRENTSSRYVFPNAVGTNCFKEPQKVMNFITAQSGVFFTLHDLRRTFASIAESLDIPAYALKRLLNHKLISSDVTAGYIVSDIDRLKVPMQKITDRLLELSVQPDHSSRP